MFFLAAARLSNPASGAESKVDFNRDIRPILSQNCFLCHGPDEKERKSGLRLDVREEALKPAKSGKRAIIPGQPEQSELIARIQNSDPDELMPPTKSGKKLSAAEIDTLRRWVAQGANYATHWAYAKPVRPPLPKVKRAEWPRNGIDYFILERLEREGLQPMPEADPHALARRVSLDLTGLPPTPAEVRQFLEDPSPDAYEKFVDRLLDKAAFGEHWARMWLDLARYADSAGYADDPLRTIWAFRDYVIRAFNQNKPFDQFTLEQIAGDLLPDPTEDQLIATAFHRNTMTNNEGGTNDEEFRSAAIVDRVNTTMAVWMGSSMACAQCHNHKYDPISQEEYFRFYAFFNNTEDADRADESPTLKFFTPSQKQRRAAWEAEIARLEEKLRTPTPELLAAFSKWDEEFPREVSWRPLKPEKGIYRREATTTLNESTVSVSPGDAAETYSLELPLKAGTLSAVRLEIPASEKSRASKSLITRVSASIVPSKANEVSGRFVRIDLPGKDKILSLAEVQVFSGVENIAGGGEASQSSTELSAPAKLAIDGNTSGNFNDRSVTHTSKSENPWWELDLKDLKEISRVVVWNRTDNGLHTRLKDFRVSILGQKREVLWEKQFGDAPNPNLAIPVDGTRAIRFAAAFADSFSSGNEPGNVLVDKADPKKGWAPAGDADHWITLLAENAVSVPAGAKLNVLIEQSSEREHGWLESFRLAATAEPRFHPYARMPGGPLTLLAAAPDRRGAKEKEQLLGYYLRNAAPALQSERERVAQLQKQLDEMKPNTVPIMRELAGDKRRKTHIQFRGNFMDLGREVEEGVPAAFHPLPANAPRNRLALARWLVDENNPLTARVVVNRFWEQIFGIGLVRTSEEFGSQGELPSHPELLDWLATEFMAQKWDMKKLLKLLVTSAAYRQSSRVTPELAERDPENRLLARGPRFRMSAEMVRDQALFVAGLLSAKMHGPSVKPPRPASGLSAAFGSSVDWKTSEGEDRLRRGIYTEWRRTSPYPSMTTFDAPNREVCTLRRTRTNTPLQALVTLNDPVYVEAAQGVARQMMALGRSVADRVRAGFELCLARPPSEKELNRVSQLFAEALGDFARNPSEKAELLVARGGASDEKEKSEVIELAAWTTVANVLLNLDETLMKP